MRSVFILAHASEPPGTYGPGFLPKMWAPELKHLCCVLSRFSRVQLFVTLWTVAHQAPLSMGFSRQGYWSGLPFPSPGDLPDPGIESTSPATPALQVDSLLLSHWMNPFLWQRETKQALVIILMRVLIPS